MKTENKTIDHYIKAHTPEVQNILLKLKNTIQKSAPDAVEAFSYGVPAFKLNSKNVILFAAFKNHIGIYPDPPAIEAFKKELQQYELSKGTIKFPLDQPIPFGLIDKIVKYKVNKILTDN